jgi:CheY-like chemotaxis protein
VALILVVDDEPANRLLVKTLLEHAGHTLLEAAAGPVALETAVEYRPDLLLLDLSIPGMSGTEVVRALRSRPETAAVAIAIYTASAIHPAFRDFMELYGIRHVIPKPAEPQALLRAIEAALEG